MEAIKFSVLIKASAKKVWDTMLDKETYEIWTSEFMEGSTFEGSWEEGSEMRFLAPNKEGGLQDGMFGRIKENDKYNFISIEHLGFIKDGKIDTTSKEAQAMTPAFENYTFKEQGDSTELVVEVQTNQITKEYKEMFERIWPRALEKLKSLCEDE